MTMDSTTPVNKLAETIHSLLGLKVHLNSSWVTSVCDIVKSLESNGSTADSKSTNFETKCCTDRVEDDTTTDTKKIKDELSALTTYINQLNIQRKQLLNEFLDLKGNIRVFARIRPIAQREKFGYLRPVSAIDSSSILLKLSDQKSKRYIFDRVFQPGSSQDDVFCEVEPVIKSALDGYNACIFAYGQTGTGKTFTMEGTQECPGVVPRTIEALFKQAADSNHVYLFSFSMLEIYLGNLRDLLVAQPTKPMDPVPPLLSIQTDPTGGVDIDNLVAIKVNNYNQALKLYKLGCRFRSTASTGSNVTSSRSHCMIRISISCSGAPERRRETNKIWLIDLGGSERVLKTRASGRRLEEGKAINLSLSALGDVIQALQRKKCHVPYRNSKLTQVLKDSLGQDSKTLMLVHVSPKEEDLCETICALNFAARARSIHLGCHDSAEERNPKEALMTSLQQEMKKIEEKRSDVRREFQTLNEKLEILTMTAPFSPEEHDASHLSFDIPTSNPDVVESKITDIRAVASSQLPRFMRPTVCSRRKSGSEHENSRLKKLTAPRRRRRTFSNRAESIALPVNAGSDYNSEYSVSRASCMVSLNVKPCEDNETEYSQDISESDVKTIESLQSESCLRSIPQKAQCHSIKNKNRTYKHTSTGFAKVDNWLHLRETEHISSYGSKSKQVSAIPTPKNKLVSHRKSKTGILPDERTEVDKFCMEDIVNQQMERSDDVQRGSRFIPETSLKPLLQLGDIVNVNQVTTLDSLSSKPDDEKPDEAEHLGDGFPIENDQCCIESPPDIWFPEIDKISVSREVEGEINSIHSTALNNGEYCQCLSDSDYKKSLDLYSTSDTISNRECILDETEPEFQRSKLNTISQCTKRELKCRRALLLDNENEPCLKVPFLRSQQRIDNSGIFCLLKKIIHVLWGSTILGLGIQKLGYNADFFYGLTR